MATSRLKNPIITVIVFAHKFTFFWCENIGELFHNVSCIITLKISKGITFIISFKEAVGIIFMNGTTNYSTFGSLITTTQIFNFTENSLSFEYLPVEIA